MPSFAASTPITANGIYTLDHVQGDKDFKLAISGTTNGATVKLEYVNINGANVEYDSSNTTFANTTGGAIFNAHDNMQLNVTGAEASTNIAVICNQLG